MRCSKYYIDIKIFKTLTLLCLLDGNIFCAYLYLQMNDAPKITLPNGVLN